MYIQENVVDDIHQGMIRTLCRKASHVEAYYSNLKNRVGIELTADRIKAYIFCPEEDWTLYTARPTGKCSDQQFMSFGVQLSALCGQKCCMWDTQEMSLTFELGLARVVLSGPMDAIW